MKNRDMKNYRASEQVHVFKLCSWLMIGALIAVLAVMGERDHQAKVEQVSKAAQCGVGS